jgi:hypothetical protein
MLAQAWNWLIPFIYTNECVEVAVAEDSSNWTREFWWKIYGFIFLPLHIVCVIISTWNAIASVGCEQRIYDEEK